MVSRVSLIVACSVLLGACFHSSPTSPSSATASVEYRITGSAVSRVSITYENATGGTSQISSAALPWSFSRSAKTGDFLYVSGQIAEGTGTMTVSVYVNGSVFKTSTSSGFAAIATASGSCCS